MASRLHKLTERGCQRLDRLAVAGDAGDGRARATDRRGRRDGCHLQPDDLPEGDGRGWLVRRPAPRGRSREQDDPREIFLALAIEDIRGRCDLLRPVWDATAGVDGYVSLEVDPGLAYDREGTFEQAMRLHETVERQNLYVKIPATRAGSRRDRGLHREGQVDQRHPDLLAGAVRGRRRGVRPRARAARRRRRRPRAR